MINVNVKSVHKQRTGAKVKTVSFLGSPSWGSTLLPEAVSPALEQTAVPVQMSSWAIFPRPRSPSVTSSSADTHFWLSTRFLCWPRWKHRHQLRKLGEKVGILKIFYSGCRFCLLDHNIAHVKCNLWISNGAHSCVICLWSMTVCGQCGQWVLRSGSRVTTSECRLQLTGCIRVIHHLPCRGCTLHACSSGSWRGFHVYSTLQSPSVVLQREGSPKRLRIKGWFYEMWGLLERKKKKNTSHPKYTNITKCLKARCN